MGAAVLWAAPETHTDRHRANGDIDGARRLIHIHRAYREKE
eukprot:COSAG02_NODE_31251_length_536_cov_2.331808_1_plen_40_part_10